MEQGLGSWSDLAIHKESWLDRAQAFQAWATEHMKKSHDELTARMSPRQVQNLRYGKVLRMLGHLLVSTISQGCKAPSFQFPLCLRNGQCFRGVPPSLSTVAGSGAFPHLCAIVYYFRSQHRLFPDPHVSSP